MAALFSSPNTTSTFPSLHQIRPDPSTSIISFANSQIFSVDILSESVCISPLTFIRVAVAWRTKSVDFHLDTCHSSKMKWEETGGVETGGEPSLTRNFERR